MEDALVSIPLEFALKKIAQVLGKQIGMYAGAARELKRIEKSFQYIKAFVRDAESKQVAQESVRVWLSDLKGIAHDIEDVLNEWQISGLENDGSQDDDVDQEKVRTCFPSPSACFNRSASRFKIAPQIKEIRERLDQIAESQKLFNFTKNSGGATPISSRRQAGSLTDESQIIGRDEDMEAVISRLVSGSSSGDGDGQQVHVTAIVGIGGLGKTTLAQQIYNDVNVKNHFNQALYFVCVSEVFDVIRLIKAILEQVNRKSPSVSELPSLQQELLRSLEGKRFLLVLDDLWNDDAQKWEPLRLSLKSGAQGSRILVTTRSERVANIMNAAYIHQLKGLSDDLSWTLFSSRAFAGRAAEEYSEFVSIGRQIVSKCRGVPLSIKVMGSAMNSKRTRADWQNILDSKMWSLRPVSDEILPALMLSYYNLPPHLKQCFAYCSIYQKDTKMHKDELVKLWITQDFIQPDGNREMEDIGEEYFNELVACSMFEEVRETYQEKTNQMKTTCRMHDLLHDLAEYIAKDESHIFTSEKSNQCSVDVRHASLFLSKDNLCIPKASAQAKKLRTLFVDGSHKIDTILDDLFRQARFLRVLVFRWCRINMLPETIGKLKHLRYMDLSDSFIGKLPNAFETMKQLRYLDLSGTYVVELPESMCHLVRLHTLNLNSCRQLKELPIGMGRMVSLRHLQIEGTESLECLPKGLGGISGLRSLCKFMVGGEGGCGIDELQQLNCLRGSLSIYHLERVSSPEEAKKAELWNKSDLRRLSLTMSSGRDEEIVMSGRNDAERERAENVLDGLRPHANLERLSCYGSGSKFKLPRWMEDSTFSRLTDLNISDFSHPGQNLPGLGKLPALKKLSMWTVGVRKIGDEFYYGMNGNDVDGKRREEAFPKLEELWLHDMFKLEEWELTSVPDAPKVMSSLRQLWIINCPELQVLPPHLAYAPLSRLQFEDMQALTCLPDWLRQLQSLERLSVVGCQKLESLPESLGQLKSLKSLSVDGCQKLESLPESLGELKSLKDLSVKSCQTLESLPDSLGQLESLKDLSITSCQTLKSLPDSLGQLKSLKDLSIRYCQTFKSLPESLGQLKKLEHLDIDEAGLSCLPGSLGQLESLKRLSIGRCQALESLPDSLGQLESLKSLSITSCQTLGSLPQSLIQLKMLDYLFIYKAGLSCLPDSLGQLESLVHLDISGCKKLASLPDSLGQLKKLKYLEIKGAEALTRLPDSLGQLESLGKLEISGCKKLASLPDSLGQLKKLWHLEIGAEALTRLPDSLGQLEKLKHLEIEGAEALTRLPDSLGQLESLEQLTIKGCQKLLSLPHPLQVHRLSISGCPLLSEECKREGGEDWPKISHIRTIEIDHEVIKSPSIVYLS